MQEIINHFESLDELEKEHILNSSTLKEDYIEEISELFEHITLEEINITLDSLFAQSNKDLDVLFELRDVKRNLNNVSWDDGSPYRLKKHRGELMKSFNEMLIMENGLSKTDLLVRCKKDNGKWRPIADFVLNYMVGNRVLVRIGRKYYLSDKLMSRESTFHRLVYDLICNGPSSMSAILNKLGYRNPKGKKKLLQVLDIMEEEGLIFKEGRYWNVGDDN